MEALYLPTYMTQVKYYPSRLFKSKSSKSKLHCSIFCIFWLMRFFRSRLGITSKFDIIAIDSDIIWWAKYWKHITWWISNSKKQIMWVFHIIVSFVISSYLMRWNQINSQIVFFTLLNALYQFCRRLLV